MNIIKKKPNCVLLLFWILCFMVVAVHADSGKRSFFAENPGLFDCNYLSGLNKMSVAAQSRPMYVKPWVSSNEFVLEVLAGVAGNLIGALGGAMLGHSLSSKYGYDSTTTLLGGAAGSLCGSALGVYIVGNSGDARGKFGNALAGSLMGEIASLGILLLTLRYSNGFGENGVGFLSMAILPPLFATINFNRSLRYKNLPEGNGLLNFNKDKLTLGIPDIQIHPLSVYGKNMKPEFQFKINVLSVML